MADEGSPSTIPYEGSSASGPSDLRLENGEELVPGFFLSQRIGRGGFSEVWKANGPGGVPAALKVVRFEEGGAAAEATALDFMKYVSHPQLMAIFGIWHRAPYIVIGMELAQCTLADRLRRAVESQQEGIPFDELLEYMREVAKGIDYLNEPRHTIGGHSNQAIIHRDIKPHNLLVVGGSAKVGDFGLARIMERSGIASSGGMTPAYAAPELFQRQVCKQTDQYSLAVSYCKLRGNSIPFIGSPSQLMAGHLTQQPNLSMIPEIERQVIGRALAKEGNDRWPNCRVFIEKLADCHTFEYVQNSMTQAATESVISNSLGMKLVLIPAGKFLMGSPDTENERNTDEGPQHYVNISRPFYMSAFPVTQQQYEAVIGYNPSFFQAELGGGPNHPVDSVSWHDAVEFCRRLTSRFEERDAGRFYYLPTEAEWEYACRAGTATATAFGSSLSSFQANFNGDSPYGDAPRGPFREMTTPVGSFEPNGIGLSDMHGNVWEWCADLYEEFYYRMSPGRDPLGPRSGERRVLRGGNWNSTGGKNCRSARRGKDRPTAATQFDGLRIVMIPH